MSSRDDELNPYAASDAAPADYVVDQTVVDDSTRYYFSGSVYPRQIYASSRQWDAVIGLTIVYMLVVSLMLVGFRWDSSQDHSLLVILLAMITTLFTMAIWWAFVGRARMVLRRSPLSVGAVRGFISPYRLHIERLSTVPDTPAASEDPPLMVNESLMNTLLEVDVRKELLLMSFDVSRVSQIVLPLTLFQESEREELLNLVQSKKTELRPAISILDQRLIDNEPLPVPEPPAGAVPFRGDILGADLEGSPLRLAWRRHVRTMTLIALIGCSVAALPLLFPDDIFAAGVLLWPIGVGFVLISITAFARLRKVQDPNQCLFQSAGWIAADNAYASVATSNSCYTWRVFEDYAVTDRAITLRLPGAPERHVIIAKRTFANEQDWQQAVDYARTGMQQALTAT